MTPPSARARTTTARLGVRRLDANTAEFLVGAAVHAPSLLNSQPWRFQYLPDGSIRLWADRARRLPALDPCGRELVVSCGAALGGLRLGLRWLGYDARVTYRPDPRHPALLASIELGQPERPGRSTVDRFTAILDRYTRRGSFADEPLSPTLVNQLCHAVTGLGAQAYLIDDLPALRRVARLTARAQQIHDHRAAARADLCWWLRRPGSRRRDGLPVDALRPARVGDHALTARQVPGIDNGCPTTRPAPTTILIGTDRDDLSNWLRVGEAAYHLLLTAAHHSVFASIHTQPVEVPATRRQLARLTGARRPQLLLQLGYAFGVPAVPRRPPADVLTLV